MARPRLSFLLLVLFSLAFLAVAGWGWLGQEAGAKELMLPLTKFHDFEEACRASSGIAWWTPNYLQGCSLAPFWQTSVLALWYEGGRVALGACGVDAVAAYKIMALGLAFLSALAMYGFVAALTGSARTAALAGAFYLLCPEMAIRLAREEHLGTVGCFPFAPLLLWLILRLGREPSLARALALALGTAAMLLTSTKVALLFMPVAALFAAWIALAELGTLERRLAFLKGLVVAFAASLPLALLPLLPLLREQRLMTFFAHDPLAEWQDSFAIKTALSFWDRGGVLLSGAPAGYHLSADAFYGGVFWVSAMALLFLVDKAWLATAEGGRFRLFVGAALVLETVSFGLSSPLRAHREILANSQAMENWSIPLLWLALAAQVLLVGRLVSFVPFSSRWSRLAFVVGVPLFWIALPLFPAVERLPGFGQIRAPASFWNMGGSFCLAVAGALAWGRLLDLRAPRLEGKKAARFLPWAAPALVALLLLDFLPYHAAFFRGGLPPSVLADYRAACAFLADEASSGRDRGTVLALSGRYFYLDLPGRTGRPLYAEAAMSYLQPEAARALAEAGKGSAQLYQTALAAGGVTRIVIDKTDPELPPAFSGPLRQYFSPVFENDGFAILDVSGQSGATALALPPERVRLVNEGVPPAQLLTLRAEGRYAIVPAPGFLPPEAEDDGRPLPPRFTSLPRLPDADPNVIRLAAAPFGTAWVAVPANWHPDWTAVDETGQPLPVGKALGAYLAAPLSHPNAAVTFRFRPPAWYDLCLGVSAAAWCAAIGALLFLSFRRKP